MGRYQAKKKKKSKLEIPDTRTPPVDGPPKPKLNRETGKPNSSKGGNQFKGKANWPKNAPGDLSKTKKKPSKVEGKGPVKSGKEYGKHLDSEKSRKDFKKDQAEFEKKLDKGMAIKKERDAKAKAAKAAKANKAAKDKATKEAAAKEKKEWLDKTRNSPAAKAGFSDKERWALQQKHREWKANRSKKKSTPKTNKEAGDRIKAAKTKATPKKAATPKKSTTPKKDTTPKKSKTSKNKGPAGKINLPAKTKTKPGLTDPNANIAKLMVGSKTRKRTKRRA